MEALESEATRFRVAEEIERTQEFKAAWEEPWFQPVREAIRAATPASFPEEATSDIQGSLIPEPGVEPISP